MTEFSARLLELYHQKSLTNFPHHYKSRKYKDYLIFLENEILCHPRPFPINDYAKIMLIIIMDLKKENFNFVIQRFGSLACVFTFSI